MIAPCLISPPLVVAERDLPCLPILTMDSASGVAKGRVWHSQEDKAGHDAWSQADLKLTHISRIMYVYLLSGLLDP